MAEYLDPDSLEADEERRAVLAYVAGACKTLPTPYTLALHHHTSGTRSLILRTADGVPANVDAWHAAMVSDPATPAPRHDPPHVTDRRTWHAYRFEWTLDLGEYGTWKAELWCTIEDTPAQPSTYDDSCAVNGAAELSTATDGCAVKDGA